MALTAGYARHRLVGASASVWASSTTDALPMPHCTVLAGALSMTTAAARSPGYCSACPVSGSAGAEWSERISDEKEQPLNNTAHSAAAAAARVQMRFMAFPSFTDS